ncbi:DUF3575 domain-containing protein [Sphingobacterium sp. LRF_L2]|uniref:DUF3575 domain-containing protein n=1 Tax=Sphingobacterium sp. LRF_L2 TaxID=3369421 RepID=UPI003F5FCCCB
MFDKIKQLAALFGIILLTPVQAQVKEKSQDVDTSFYELNLRTNIPYWFLALPNIGIEYRSRQQFAVLLDGSFAPWNFKRKGNDHYWRLWNVAPEIRYYIGSQRSTYLGLQYNMGEHNFSRQQGRFMGGGISFGKQYVAAGHLLIDIGLTIGYLRFTEQERYEQVGDILYRTKMKTDDHYWGPTNLSIRLSRKLN